MHLENQNPFISMLWLCFLLNLYTTEPPRGAVQCSGGFRMTETSPLQTEAVLPFVNCGEALNFPYPSCSCLWRGDNEGHVEGLGWGAGTPAFHTAMEQTNLEEYVRHWAQTGQVQGFVSWCLRYVTVWKSVSPSLGFFMCETGIITFTIHHYYLWRG